MSKTRIHDEHRLDRTIRHLVAGLLVFMPLTLGAVQGWSEAIVVAWVTLITACLAMRFILGRAPFVLSWTYLPAALFIGLAAFQLVPLPGSLVKLISPATFELKHASSNWMTLSLYPLATRQTLRVVLCATVIFVAVINVFRRSSQIKWLLMTIAAIGGGAALLALAQDVSATKAVYWLIPRPNGQIASGGPFINYNHYAQFANLSLGASLGLLLALMAEWHKREDWSFAKALRQVNRPELAVVRWLVMGIIFLAVSVFLSRSRGGMISLLVASCLTGAWMAMSRRLVGRGWILGLIGVGVFVALLAGGLDTALDRLGTLQHAREAGKARIEVATDVLTQLVPKFPVLGIGLGAHEVVYPMASRQTFVGAAEHVENEYVQIVEEMGGTGLVLVACFVVMIAACWVRSLGQDQRPVRPAVFGLGLGLIAVLIHSLSDFGQRIPAVACLTAVMCGLLVSISGSRQVPTTQPSSPGVKKDRVLLMPLAGCLVAMLILGWAMDGAVCGALAEWRWGQTTDQEKELARKAWRGSDEDFARLLVSAESAADWEPDNIVYRHWLNVYRLYAISQPGEGESEAVPDARTMTFAQRIADDELKATAMCPTYGPAYCVAGQIELFTLGKPEGAQLIQRGYELGRSHPETCFVAGLSDASRGLWDESLTKLKRAALLGHPMDAVLDVYLRQYHKPELALQIASGNMQALAKIADVLGQRPEDATLAATARAQAEELLRESVTKDNAGSWLLAEMAQLEARQKNYDAATDYYRRALIKDYNRVDWHLELARVLLAAGQPKEAEHEARVCLRLRPNMGEAQKLIADLTGRPGSALTDE